MTRIAAIGLFGVMAATASADRVITVPTGRKILYRTARYEFRTEPHSGGTAEQLFGVGIGTSIEAEFRSTQLYGADLKDTLDLAYNVVAPIPDISPGISFGVQDAFNRTTDGRRFFAAFTTRQVVDTLNGAYTAEVTLGVMKGKYTRPYVGLSLPFSEEFRLLVEHNGLRAAAGFEIRPAPMLGLRFQVREKQTFVSAQITTRF